jgi:DNA-binding transcriptional MerR regulator
MKSNPNKAATALKTIGETAEFIEVPAHVIRFWETKFLNIKPVKYNNRRYYNKDNLDILNEIKTLLYEKNYSIADAIEVFKKKNTINKKDSRKVDLSTLVRVKERLIKAKNKLNAILQK